MAKNKTKDTTSKKEVKRKDEKEEEKEVVDEDVEEKEEAIKVIREVIVKEPEKPAMDFNELELTKERVALLTRTIAKGATKDELLMFINVCRGLGLSPFLNHIHMVKRWDTKEGREVASIQVGIDGFRSIAESTGAYAGNTDPEFGEPKDITYKPKQGPEQTISVPSSAKVIVTKIVQGSPYKFTATARWDEFYPGDKQGFMWRDKPHVMLGKCAEAQALRKAFPKVLSGVYAPEELERNEKKAPEATAEDKFKKAKEMIQAETDSEVLKDYLKKLKTSETYNTKQKKELSKITSDRIKELDTPEEK